MSSTLDLIYAGLLAVSAVALVMVWVAERRRERIRDRWLKRMGLEE